MRQTINAFFLMVATATDRESARHVEYLKAENRIFRARLPKRIILTTQERQTLLRFGAPLGSAIRHLITIVSPSTFLRWINCESKSKPKKRKPGRPRTPGNSEN